MKTLTTLITLTSGLLLGLATLAGSAVAQSKSSDDTSFAMFLVTQMAANLHQSKQACGQLTPEQAQAARERVQQSLEKEVPKQDFDAVYERQLQISAQRWEAADASSRQQYCQRLERMAP